MTLLPDRYDLLFYLTSAAIWTACVRGDSPGWGALFAFVSVFAWRYWRRAKW